MESRANVFRFNPQVGADTHGEKGRAQRAPCWSSRSTVTEWLPSEANCRAALKTFCLSVPFLSLLQHEVRLASKTNARTLVGWHQNHEGMHTPEVKLIKRAGLVHIRTKQQQQLASVMFPGRCSGRERCHSMKYAE